MSEESQELEHKEVEDILAQASLAISENTPLSEEQLDAIADTALSVLQSILLCFKENTCSIDEYDGDEGELILDISGGDLAILIGRHGVTLDALQVIFSSLLTKKLGFHYPVILDIEGYKLRRRDKVQTLARNAASRAKKNNAVVKLNPMNAYERRLVHITLRGDHTIVTHSEGDDPQRYVVITPVALKDTGMR